MATRHKVLVTVLMLASIVNLGLAMPRQVLAQQSPMMKDDLEQLAVDLKVGVDRSTLTPQQKEQLRDDFRELREAHKNNQMFGELRAARSIRTALNSGAFRPQDRDRIKQDMQALKASREDQPGGFMGGGHGNF